MSQAKGRDAEQELANWLDDRGYEVDRTHLGRGPADIIASRGTLLSKRWMIQVKATNEESFPIYREDARNLLRHAKAGKYRCAFAVRFGWPQRWRVYTFNRVRDGAPRVRFRVEKGKRPEDVF